MVITKSPIFAKMRPVYNSNNKVYSFNFTSLHTSISSTCIHMYIGQCDSTLYVGLTCIVRKLIQKSMGWFGEFNKHFFVLGVSKARDNTKAAMKKRIRRIHSVFSHVGP